MGVIPIDMTSYDGTKASDVSTASTRSGNTSTNGVQINMFGLRRLNRQAIARCQTKSHQDLDDG